MCKALHRTRRLICVTALLLFGVWCLTYNFFYFNQIPSSKIPPLTQKRQLISNCSKIFFIKTSSGEQNPSKVIPYDIDSVIEISFRDVIGDISTIDDKKICKHSPYWNQATFPSSWREMIQPCLNNMEYRKNVNRQDVTSIKKSHIVFKKNTDETILHLKIFSKSLYEEYKTFGGDSWIVTVTNDQISFSVDMLDKNDGTYESFIEVPENGLYNVTIKLLYSLCEGFMDPPKNFFKTGMSFRFIFSCFVFNSKELEESFSMISLTNKEQKGESNISKTFIGLSNFRLPYMNLYIYNVIQI